MDKILLKYLYNLGLKNKKAVVYTAITLPNIFVVLYILGIALVFFFKRQCLLKFVLIPMIVLFTVTIIRKIVNRKRPFQVVKELKPFIPHDDGESFPSRHTASSFIIGMAFLYVNIYIGVPILVLSFVVGLSRIMAGLHYPSDVLFGGVYSIIIGYIGFFII